MGDFFLFWHNNAVLQKSRYLSHTGDYAFLSYEHAVLKQSRAALVNQVLCWLQNEEPSFFSSLRTQIPFCGITSPQIRCWGSILSTGLTRLSHNFCSSRFSGPFSYNRFSRSSPFSSGLLFFLFSSGNSSYELPATSGSWRRLCENLFGFLSLKTFFLKSLSLLSSPLL